jgi:hypothetical protein
MDSLILVGVLALWGAAGEDLAAPRCAHVSGAAPTPEPDATPEGNQKTRTHRFDATENRARSPGPCPLTRDSLVVVVARLFPTRRDVEGSPRARRAVGPHVVLELVMNACTDEPGWPFADKTAKDGQIRGRVYPATEACSEIQRTGHHIIRLQVTLIGLDVGYQHRDPGFKSTGDISRRRA